MLSDRPLRSDQPLHLRGITGPTLPSLPPTPPHTASPTPFAPMGMKQRADLTSKAFARNAHTPMDLTPNASHPMDLTPNASHPMDLTPNASHPCSLPSLLLPSPPTTHTHVSPLHPRTPIYPPYTKEWIPVAAVRVRDSLRLLRLVFLIKNQRSAEASARAGVIQLHSLDLREQNHDYSLGAPSGAHTIQPPPSRRPQTTSVGVQEPFLCTDGFTCVGTWIVIESLPPSLHPSLPPSLFLSLRGSAAGVAGGDVAADKLHVCGWIDQRLLNRSICAFSQSNTPAQHVSAPPTPDITRPSVALFSFDPLTCSR